MAARTVRKRFAQIEELDPRLRVRVLAWLDMRRASYSDPQAPQMSFSFLTDWYAIRTIPV